MRDLWIVPVLVAVFCVLFVFMRTEDRQDEKIKLLQSEVQALKLRCLTLEMAPSVDLTPLEKRLHDVECDKVNQTEFRYVLDRVDVLEQWARDLVEWSYKESSWVNQYFSAKGTP